MLDESAREHFGVEVTRRGIRQVQRFGAHRKARRRSAMSRCLKQKTGSLLLATGIAEPASLKRWVKTAAADLAALDLDPGRDGVLSPRSVR